MGNELDYEDGVEDEDTGEGWSNDFPRTKSRDCRRVIEELREERRLRALLEDFDEDDDED